MFCLHPLYIKTSYFDVHLFQYVHFVLNFIGVITHCEKSKLLNIRQINREQREKKRKMCLRVLHQLFGIIRVTKPTNVHKLYIYVIYTYTYAPAVINCLHRCPRPTTCGHNINSIIVSTLRFVADRRTDDVSHPCITFL